MKKTLLTAILGMCGMYAFGQGQVNMSTYIASGTTQNYLKASNTVAQTWATGSFYAALYYGTSADSINTLVAYGGASGAPAGLCRFLTGGGAGYITSATASGGGTRVDNTAVAGSTAFFQIKAWSDGFTTYDAAYAAAVGGNLNVLLGKGPVVSTVWAGTTGSPPPTPTVIAWGGTAASPLVFNLSPIPEPSVIALGALGLVGLVFLRRRK